MDFKHELVMTNDDLPFRIFVFEGKEGNYRVDKHWHQSVEIFLVLEGNIDFYINSEHYPLSHGQFILVNSNEIHSIECPEKNFTIVLQIPSQIFEDYQKDHYIYFKSTRYEKDATLISLIEHIYRAYGKKEYAYLFDVLSDFNKVIYILLTKYRVEEVDKERRKLNKQLAKLSQITEYINENFKEELTLEQIAGQFGFSTAYLSRMFQKYAKINYKTYLMNLRTDEAYKRLINTSEPIGEIAMKCGFPDSRSMAKVFKNRLGILPSELRRQVVSAQKEK